MNLAIDDADSATLLAYLSGTDYDSRLATAKRITVDVGMFDILNPTIKYVCEVLGIDPAENDGEAVLEKLNALQINEVLEDAQALETKMKTDEVVAELTAATEAFASNFAAIIAKLKEINPTADIVVYDIYNPMAGFKISNALLSYIISTSSINLESIGEKYTVMMNDAINAHHDEVGGYIIVSLYGFNATASDGMTNVKVPDINELFNSLGTTDFNNIDWENININGGTGGTGDGTGDGTGTTISFEIAYDPHPSEAGHQEIHDRTVERRPTIEVPAPVTLNFNTNGGTPVSSISVPLGDTVDLTKYTSTKEGYVFAGWGQTSTASKVITSYKMTANKTVYAIWTQPTVNLVFETNGGDAISSAAVLQGSTVDLSAYVPTREGFIFTHWYSDAELTNLVTSVKVDADTTVYAGWREEGTAA
ncbi:MAG: InlB B-repeat-containing protein, partial [Oscillospiraceae bacterium]|nr:InlB B-repeat-containing protein [Oscillospiraceae bacterium]